jgi:hypothetical protein
MRTEREFHRQPPRPFLLLPPLGGDPVRQRVQHLVTLVRVPRLQSEKPVPMALAGRGEVFTGEVLDPDSPNPLDPVALLSRGGGIHAHMEEGGFGVGQDQEALAAKYREW